MQGLVTLDLGNTHPHAGIFQRVKDQWKLDQVVPLSNLLEALTHQGLNPSNTSMVLCEVRPREEKILEFLNRGFLITKVKEYWRGQRFAGMPVNYASSLGEDRLIVAHYCYKLDKTPTLIIDAGTYVTMDVVDNSGFHGGYIIPGSNLYASLFQKGEQLKSIQVSPHLDPGLPHGTAEAMSGGYRGFANLAKEVIQGHGIRRVILTGGETSLWEKFLSGQNLKLEIEPHFIHKALQHWMVTQIELL